MMISSYVVRNLCGYFVITCWKHTADKQINQQDFNTARARTITSFQVPPQHCLFQIQPGISWVRKYSFHPNLETSEYPIYSSFFLSLSHNITDSKKCLDNSNTDANFSVRKISRPPYLRSSVQQRSILTRDFTVALLVSQTSPHCLKMYREKVLCEEKNSYCKTAAGDVLCHNMCDTLNKKGK